MTNVFIRKLLSAEINLGLLNYIFALVMAILAYGFNNPYAAFFIPASLGIGLLLLLEFELNTSLILAIGPSLGYSLLILLSYTDSILKIGIQGTGAIFGVLTILLSLGSLRKRHAIRGASISELLSIFLPIIAVVATRAFVYTYPTDNVDNLFHATKIRYILMYNSMYPQAVPIFNMYTYPGGYHAIVAYIVSTTNVTIPLAMKAFRILAWSLFMLGVYSLAMVWFNETVARFSLLAVLVTNLGYYYLLVYIEPNFFGFYFFLVLLTIAYLFLTDKRYHNVKTYVVSIAIGAGTIFVHPYTFQNFIFVIGLYVVLKSIRRLRVFPGIKVLLKLTLVFGVIPMIIYTALNPYFMFPNFAHVSIECPWASTKGVVMENLAVMRNKLPHDNWSFFHLLLSWTFTRNKNYLASLFMLFSLVAILKKREYMLRYLSLLGFYIFVLLLIINRLTVNIPVPLYGSAAIERMYLWTLPLFPIFIALGMASFYEFKNSTKSTYIKVIYSLVVISFFLLPTWGTARDLVSDEANFYVTQDVVDDFHWIKNNFPSGYILNSCHADSTPWLPFFDGWDYKVMFNKYICRCRFNGIPSNVIVSSLLRYNKTLPDTIAYIDTNAPSLNPVAFLSRYELLRINGNNWIFNLSSRNTTKNAVIAANALQLCSSTLPGDTYTYGKYYVWGFAKKYFYVEYYHFSGEDFAWLTQDIGIIMFSPCREYDSITITAYAPHKMAINVTVNGKRVVSQEILKPGFNVIKIENVSLVPGSINTIEISKTEGMLPIKEITLGDVDNES